MSNNTNNNRLYTERMSAIADIRAIDQRLGNKPIGAEDRATLDRLNGVITDIDSRIQANIQADERSAASDRHDAIAGMPTGSRSGGMARGENTSSILAEFLGAGTRGQSRSIEFADGGVVDPTTRSLLTSTSGASVETQFVEELFSVLTNGAPVWEAARRIQTDHTRTLEYPNLAGHGTGAALVAESAAIGDSTPTLSTISLNHYKYAQILSVSSEAESAVIESLQIVAKDMLNNVGVAAESAFVLGTGSAQPMGLANAGYAATNLGGVIAPTSLELLTALHSVAPQYRRAGNMKWIMADSTIASIRALTDSNGAFLWAPGLSAGQPDQLFGHDVIASADVPGVGANVKCAYFVDMSKFVVRETPIRLERSDDYAWANDRATFRAIVGVDSAVTDTASGTVLTCAAS